MTPMQQADLEKAWKPVETKSQAVKRAGENLKQGGLAQLAQDELERRLDIYDAAVKDHQVAVEVAADVLRAAGVNI